MRTMYNYFEIINEMHQTGEDEEDEDEDGWAAMRDGDRKKKRGQEKEADDEEGYEEEDMYVQRDGLFFLRFSWT